ncbi:MAG: hypothetical protein C0509_08090, partial [Acinetobacter sp.]|nr:hypothetical protein [Acinetobacter sp.]
NNLSAQGKYAEAQPFSMKALDIERKIFGEGHANTATCYNALAANLNSQGKHAEAQPLFKNALDVRRSVLGERHPLTAIYYINLASNLDSQEKYADAEPLFKNALRILQSVWGEENPNTALAYIGVASNLSGQGKHVEAKPLFENALRILQSVLGEEHLQTAAGYISVANNLSAQGKYAEAQPLLQKSLDIERKILGEAHPYTTNRYNSVALNLMAQSKHSDAMTILERAVDSYEASRLIGASGLDRALLPNSNPRLLLATLRHSNKPTEAWQLVEQSLARGLLDQQASLRSSVMTAKERIEQAKHRERLAALRPQVMFFVTKTGRNEAENATLATLIKEQREIEEKLAKLAVAVSQREVDDLDTIRKAIPSDAAMLFWIDVDFAGNDVHEHWVCVVRSTGDPKWQRLPGTGEQGKWVKEDSELPRKFRS